MNKRMKRLVLNRETVRVLAQKALADATGGALTDSCPRRCSLFTCANTTCCQTAETVVCC